jgi:hypothetical protein
LLARFSPVLPHLARVAPALEPAPAALAVVAARVGLAVKHPNSGGSSEGTGGLVRRGWVALFCAWRRLV